MLKVASNSNQIIYQMKHLLFILILLGFVSACAETITLRSLEEAIYGPKPIDQGYNKIILGIAPDFDKRVYDSELKFDNTVILYGYWPTKYTNYIADWWCERFDSKIKYIHLTNSAGRIVGAAECPSRSFYYEWIN